jgi:hypothetical protein
MSNSDVSKPANFTQNRSSSQGLKDQIGNAGAEMKQRAGEAVQASTDVARDKFREATEAAKEVAGGTADEIQSRAREQQQTGAYFIERLAGNFRDAANAFESDVPFAARGINSAADYVQEAAANIREGSFRDLVDGATDFAKRQPAAFLGISVLAGFAAVRFLRASGGNSSSSQARDTRRGSGSSGSSGQTAYASEDSFVASTSPGPQPGRQQRSPAQGGAAS